MEMGGARDMTNHTVTSLHDLADLDADGLPDLVTLSVISEGVLNKTSRFEVHRGYRDEGRLAWRSAADSTILSNGIQYEMDRHDFDGDGFV